MDVIAGEDAEGVEAGLRGEELWLAQDCSWGEGEGAVEQEAMDVEVGIEVEGGDGGFLNAVPVSEGGVEVAGEKVDGGKEVAGVGVVGGETQGAAQPDSGFGIFLLLESYAG